MNIYVYYFDKKISFHQIICYFVLVKSKKKYDDMIWPKLNKLMKHVLSVMILIRELVIFTVNPEKIKSSC